GKRAVRPRDAHERLHDGHVLCVHGDRLSRWAWPASIATTSGGHSRRRFWPSPALLARVSRARGGVAGAEGAAGSSAGAVAAGAASRGAIWCGTVAGATSLRRPKK